ncbi:ABC transporter substrate-binding protein [Cellulomonas sp. Y8]|uniref:ABC transporter substrate-binding protein n=1 Tax=Cellulomonas sp. Y8 TaxID=2591145 RepID=UPI003D75F4F8
MSRIPKLAAVLTASAIALAACSSGGDNDSSDAAGDALRYGALVDISSWAAADAPWGNSKPYVQAVYDTLLREEPDGLTPGLATEWTWDESRTALTLTLRDDVTFSDGTPFDAQVAADNLLRFRDGASEDAATLANLADVSVVDGTTITLQLTQPDPGLEVALARGAGLQAAPATFDAPDAQTNPIGSGPYVLDTDKSVPGSTYVFEARDDYWDVDTQNYESMTINVYSDATALLNAIKGGQVDVANLNSVAQAADAEAAGYDVDYVETNWKGLLLADRAGSIEEPLGDVRVRQAINYALDREALLQAIEDGQGEATSQVFAPDSDAFDSELDSAYEYDPAKAKELLAEAGYPDGITLVQPQTNFVPASDFELVAGMLAESGITLEYEQVGSTFIGDMLAGKWASFQFGLPLDAPWIAYRQFIASDAQWNVTHYEDPTVSALAERMAVGGDDAADAALEMNQYLVDQAWFAPFYRVNGAIASNEATDVNDLVVGSGVPNLRSITPAS